MAESQWDKATWDTRETELTISNTEPLYGAAREYVYTALGTLAEEFAEEFAGIADTNEGEINWELIVAQFVSEIVDDRMTSK